MSEFLKEKPAFFRYYATFSSCFSPVGLRRVFTIVQKSSGLCWHCETFRKKKIRNFLKWFLFLFGEQVVFES